MSDDPERVVVVTGDVTMDWNLARRVMRRDDTTMGMWWADNSIQVSCRRGGAALLSDLVRSVADEVRAAGQTNYSIRETGAPSSETLVHPSRDLYHHSYAMWSEYREKQGDRQKEKHKVWRVEQFLGLRRRRANAPSAWQRVRDDSATPTLLVLDDANLGFRSLKRNARGDPLEKVSPLWPLAVTRGDCSGWILTKMAHPVANGDLWNHLQETCRDRVIVLMTVNDLRLTDVQISRQISWERTAQDLFWELTNSQKVKGLANCRHVIVSLDTAGALLLSRADAPEGFSCTLFFDPANMEGTWGRAYPGRMIGYTSCLATSIAHQIMLNPQRPDLAQGVQSGIAAMRLLHEQGYDGPCEQDENCRLAFPVAKIAHLLVTAASAPLGVTTVQDPVQFLAGRMGTARPEPAPFWTILQEQLGKEPQAAKAGGRPPAKKGYYDVACDITLHGLDQALHDVPVGTFGKLVTLDRREIESYRSIHAVLTEYCSQPQKKPISVVVFGPPGAGKSFGVEQVANSVKPDEIQVCTFNLSQFSDPAQLIGALHQVRDESLRGMIPLVFWDEFDSMLNGQPLGWLRYFLSPMQDGTFQEGQVTHHIGRAIFAFAGGIYASMDEFAAAASQAPMKSSKAPDFISRLKGYVNVMGPNPLDILNPDSDRPFVIRRAILLRSQFQRHAPHLFSRGAGTGDLNIDPGVLRAFLQVSAYKHGVRSMEAIITMSALTGQAKFERSCLPSQPQLDLHVNGLEFLSLVQQPDLTGDLLERLAAATHEEYRAQELKRPTPNPAAHKAYQDLDPAYQEQNRAAAADFGRRLARIGYAIIPARSNTQPIGFPGPDLEMLAEMEHERYVRGRIDAGYHYGEKRSDTQRTHPSLKPWRKLAQSDWNTLDTKLRENMINEGLREVDKERDRAQILAIPRVMAAVGYAVVKLQSDGTTKGAAGPFPLDVPVHVAVSGHRFLAEVDKLQIAIEDGLKRIEQEFPGRPLLLFSSLAEGADRLAAGAVLKHAGAGLIVALPLPQERYMEDFATEVSKAEFRALLQQADQVVTLAPAASADAAYEAAGNYLLDQCSVLIAVWDGQSAQGQGGTGDIVARARGRGLRIIWVHAGNRAPDTDEPTSLGEEQGIVTYEGF